MTPELIYLLFSAILLVVHVLLQATFSDLSKGIRWAIGPRDKAVDQNMIASRIQRALANYLETYPAFVALAILLTLAQSANEASAFGAALYFWARVAYVPAYVSGLPMVRSIAWFAALGGLAIMIWQAI